MTSALRTRALPQRTLALTREGDSNRRDPASGAPPSASAVLDFGPFVKASFTVVVSRILRYPLRSSTGNLTDSTRRNVRALEVILNGENLCIAGVQDVAGSHLAFDLDVDGRLRRAANGRGAVHLHVWGVECLGEKRTRLEWEERALTVGDTLVLRIVDVEAASPPSNRRDLASGRGERLRNDLRVALYGLRRLVVNRFKRR